MVRSPDRRVAAVEQVVKDGGSCGTAPVARAQERLQRFGRNPNTIPTNTLNTETPLAVPQADRHLVYAKKVRNLGDCVVLIDCL